MQAPSLVLRPARFVFGFFVELLDPIPPMGVFHHLHEGCLRRQVAPKVFPVAFASCGTLPDQRAQMRCTVAIDAPTPDRNKLGAEQPRLPLRQRRVCHRARFKVTPKFARTATT